MKYLVSKKAILNFSDGRQVELVPGIQEYSKDVSGHWAFAAYATALESEPEQPEQPEQKETGNVKKQPSSNK